MSLAAFIQFGTLGDLQLGLGRNEVIDKLGSPDNWSGKPPAFGPSVTTPYDADVWFYYQDAVGIHFDANQISSSISVNPSKIDRKMPPFLEWPFGLGVKMSDFCKFLIENGIVFREGSIGDEYYIRAGTRCLVTCFPYEKGRLVLKSDRTISLIDTVVNDGYLPDFVK